ncbi:efflux transporter outer membrane subunit [Xylophilus rhododendri]|uniref:Efflux transporter outer membrane subunit n=1 Tax=Xylophilus rhododendri TaxID=2697032 RepID=A0A857JBX8_9BURK|nr:efflux transporter outer membrane subunit [Xylophilus rhododendri]QHJ00590.1 efflux transporter outer membrane subunit [Xylophilus rhododendri]
MTNKKHPLSLQFLLPLVAALVLAGCASPPPVDTQALADAPAAFKEAATPAGWTRAAPAEAQPRGQWWLAFNDPAMNALVERAGDRNTTIQEAAARLAQARALLRGAQADRLPQVGLNGGAQRQAGANTINGMNPATIVTAGVGASWEVDLSGRLAKARDAASLDADAREALLQSTRLAVQADTAQTYLSLRSLDAERALVRETVEAYRGTLDLTQRRYRNGDVAELDVVRIRTEMAATTSDALALDRRRAELEHALAVLVGDAAADFTLPTGAWDTALPTVPAGVPSTVLARRPDVAAAQASLLAAQARIGAAQAAWFPNLSLTGSAGYASPELGDLLQWSARAWSVGALLSLPLFDGGRRDAGIAQARAQFDAATAGYRGQVLGAFREVEDQLSGLRLLAEQSEVQDDAVVSATRATSLSDTRWRNGLVSQLDLLDARRVELRNRRLALQLRAARYQATVGLIRALGGSWTA